MCQQIQSQVSQIGLVGCKRSEPATNFLDRGDKFVHSVLQAAGAMRNGQQQATTILVLCIRDHRSDMSVAKCTTHHSRGESANDSEDSGAGVETDNLNQRANQVRAASGVASEGLAVCIFQTPHQQIHWGGEQAENISTYENRCSQRLAKWSNRILLRAETLGIHITVKACHWRPLPHLSGMALGLRSVLRLMIIVDEKQ